MKEGKKISHPDWLHIELYASKCWNSSI